MPTPLRVLIVEDRPSDAELMVAELERVGFEPAWRRVETESDYLAQLQTAPDIILADHTLPQFGAPQALELLKQHGLDIPCIVVTGSISEETAVERIKQGAADYILKDRMARLGAAAKRALDDKKLRAEKRRAEEEVQRNLQRIRALHEIDLAIGSTLDLRGVLDILLEKIDLVLPYAVATVRLLNKETGALEPTACRNIDEAEWRSAINKAGNTLARALPDITAPLVIRNVQTDPRSLTPEMLRRHGLVSLLRAPLMAKGEALGVLTFFTKEEHEFSDDEVEFLITLAGQAAIAIQNAQLYEQSRKQAVELERKNEQLEKSNRVKDEFLSVMSHELRTPLNVVMGYTQMIKDGLLGETNPKQDDALGKILSRANDQLGMVNNILFATVIESARVPVNREVVILAELFNELESAYHELAISLELTVSWNCAPDLPVLETDRAKLKHILQNLIDNAIKFTGKGTIRISARHDPSSKTVRFEVADTGIGIPKELMPVIFEKFRQVDSSETRIYGGVGMGLYIVKQFTEMLGGKVQVESESGKGSTFSVVLPLNPARRLSLGTN